MVNIISAIASWLGFFATLYVFYLNQRSSKYERLKDEFFKAIERMAPGKSSALMGIVVKRYRELDLKDDDMKVLMPGAIVSASISLETAERYVKEAFEQSLK